MAVLILVVSILSSPVSVPEDILAGWVLKSWVLKQFRGGVWNLLLIRDMERGADERIRRSGVELYGKKIVRKALLVI